MYHTLNKERRSNNIFPYIPLLSSPSHRNENAKLMNFVVFEVCFDAIYLNLKIKFMKTINEKIKNLVKIENKTSFFFQKFKIIYHKIIALVFLIASSTCNLFSQNTLNCSNIPVAPQALNQIQIFNRTSSHDDTVKIYFHVYRDINGNAGVDLERLDLMTENINYYFQGTGISFFYNKCEVRFVNNNKLNSSTNECDFFFKGWEHTDGIDVHVNGDETGFQAIASGIPGGELLLSGKYDNSNITSLSAIFGHEMGHCLGLLHTHHGTCPEVGISCDGSYADGGNPLDGDFVEDTPQDPYLGEHVNSICEWDHNPKCNPSGGPYDPSTHNFMSYSRPTCYNNFTEGQIARMHELMWTSITGSSPVSGEITLNVIQPVCNYLGSITANLDCPTSPFSYLWSNGATTQTIDNLSSGNYSVTITDAMNNEYQASAYIEEEIIVSPDHNLWSEVIAQYNLNSSNLNDRNIYAGEQLIIDVDYVFSNVTFSFIDYDFRIPGLIIKDEVSVEILGIDGKRSLLHSCSGVWYGVLLYEESNLKLINSDVNDLYRGIFVSPKSNLKLNSVNIRGTIQSTSEFNYGLRMLGSSDVEVINTNFYGFNLAVFGEVNNYGDRHFEGGNIENVNYGFYLLSSPINIKNYNISPQKYSIYFRQTIGSTIESCNFYSGEIGIGGFWSDGLHISNNYSEKNNVDIFGYFNLCNSINIESNDGINASDYGIVAFSSDELNISDNMFQIEGQGVSHGIQLTDCHDSKATGNNFLLSSNKMGIETISGSNNEIANNTFEYSSGSVFPLARAAVIRTLGSESEIIHNNNINGPGLLSGIHAINSSGNTYSCNDLSGILDGLGVYYNSIFHDIKGNHFFNCATDLKIRSVIGPQYYKGNEFYNGNCLAEGLTSEEIGQSWFFVNKTIPHHMPSNPIPGNEQWFRHQPVNEYYDDCPEDDPRGGRTGFDDERILSDHFDRLKLERSVSPERFFVNMMHLLEYDYAREDYSLPRYITEDPVWLQLLDWTELAEAINSLSGISKLSGQSALNQNDLDSISMLQKAYVEAADEATRELIYTQLSELMVRLSPAFDQESMIDSLEMDQLKNQFRSFSGRNDQMVERWADIYTMYIDFLQKGEVAETNKAALLAYSRECADKYGDAIHLARSMANTFDKTYFDVYDDCPEVIQPRAASNTLHAIVQPNPTKGELNIVMENPFSGTIEVFDITGKLVYSDRCENIFEKTIHLNLNEGVFMMKITSVEGDSDIEKVLITK